MADDGQQIVLNENKRPRNFVRKGQQRRVIQDNVIYINSKSNIQFLTQKCEKLLKNDKKEIIFYCMGSAIQRGILLALKLCDEHPFLTNSVNTYTTKTNSHFIPTTDEEDFEVQNQNNSTVCIRLLHNNPSEPSTAS